MRDINEFIYERKLKFDSKGYGKKNKFREYVMKHLDKLEFKRAGSRLTFGNTLLASFYAILKMFLSNM